MPKGKYIRTDDIRKKNRLGNLGKKRDNEWKLKRSLKYSGKNNPFFGKHHTKEVKKKLSIGRMDIGLKENASYTALHTYIKRRLPKPKFCLRCNLKKPFDLSNNSGKYLRDLSDWEWLCRSCHSTKDKKIKNIKWMNKYL